MKLESINVDEVIENKKKKGLGNKKPGGSFGQINSLAIKRQQASQRRSFT